MYYGQCGINVLILILKFLDYIGLYLTGAEGSSADQVTVAKSSTGRRRLLAKVTRKKAVKYVVEVHSWF